jgi:hypothetical protein
MDLNQKFLSGKRQKLVSIVNQNNFLNLFYTHKFISILPKIQCMDMVPSSVQVISKPQCAKPTIINIGYHLSDMG